MKIKFIKDYRFIGNDPDDGSDTTVQTGNVIDLENTESAQWLIDNGFAEEVKESGWWKPEEGDTYYFIDDDGDSRAVYWRNYDWEVNRFVMGNCFKTWNAAERYRDYLKAIATVRQDEGVLTPEQAATNGHIYYIYIHDEFELVVHGFNADYVSVNTVLFDTREYAQASLDKHPDEWKIIANYDWSRE